MRPVLCLRVFVLVAVFQLASPVPIALAVEPEVFTVTSEDDTDGSTCGSTCTLRQAINAANGHASTTPDSIVFNITGSGVHTITPAAGGLPAITEPVIIDGTTQPGASCTNGLRIEIDGSNANTSVNGLELIFQAGATTIRGLAINPFIGGGAGSGIYSNAPGATFRCNYLGVDPTGSNLLPNTFGIRLGRPGTIGGVSAGDRNNYLRKQLRHLSPDRRTDARVGDPGQLHRHRPHRHDRPGQRLHGDPGPQHRRCPNRWHQRGCRERDRAMERASGCSGRTTSLPGIGSARRRTVLARWAMTDRVSRSGPPVRRRRRGIRSVVRAQVPATSSRSTASRACSFRTTSTQRSTTASSAIRSIRTAP